jgi:hypothetical protein
MNVKPNQVWEQFSKSENVWRRVRVSNVSLSRVELQYEDGKHYPNDLARTFSIDASTMSDTKQFRFVSDN